MEVIGWIQRLLGGLLCSYEVKPASVCWCLSTYPIFKHSFANNWAGTETVNLVVLFICRDDIFSYPCDLSGWMLTHCLSLMHLPPGSEVFWCAHREQVGARVTGNMPPAAEGSRHWFLYLFNPAWYRVIVMQKNSSISFLILLSGTQCVVYSGRCPTF